jgi:hypothetical protein
MGAHVGTQVGSKQERYRRKCGSERVVQRIKTDNCQGPFINSTASSVGKAVKGEKGNDSVRISVDGNQIRDIGNSCVD